MDFPRIGPFSEGKPSVCLVFVNKWISRSKALRAIWMLAETFFVWRTRPTRLYPVFGANSFWLFVSCAFQLNCSFHHLSFTVIAASLIWHTPSTKISITAICNHVWMLSQTQILYFLLQAGSMPVFYFVIILILLCYFLIIILFCARGRPLFYSSLGLNSIKGER